MNDLEDRLRATLHDRADSVPPSRHAQADLERRITRRGRGLVLAAAAAAAVIAGVAIPVALNQDGGSPGGRAATTNSTGPTSRYLAGPVVIGEFTRDGVRWSYVLTVETGAQPGMDGVELVCTRQVVPDRPDLGGGGCLRVPQSWPEPYYLGAPEGTTGWVGATHSMNESLPNVFTTIAAPQVATLEFRRVDGTLVRAELKAETPGVKVFVVEMVGGVGESRGHIAKDAAGNVLEAVAP